MTDPLGVADYPLAWIGTEDEIVVDTAVGGRNPFSQVQPGPPDQP